MTVVARLQSEHQPILGIVWASKLTPNLKDLITEHIP